MGKIFYTSDLHISHANVIRFDNRPYESVAEMDEALIKNWNETVSDKDTVYVLGDFCWLTDTGWEKNLAKLKGTKILINGNHDIKNMSRSVRKYFQDVKDYKEISDNGRRVILCHYPMPFYKKDYDANTYMLYGHLHKTIEEDFMQEFKRIIKAKDNRGSSANKCNFYNCWCGFYNYKPVTLDEIIARWAE